MHPVVQLLPITLLSQHNVELLTKLISFTDIAACFYRDLREGLKQASKAAEKHHTEQLGPDQHQLQSDIDRQQDCLPSITLSVSPRHSQQSSQGISAADHSKLIGLPWLRATSPHQLLSRSAAADKITAGASQPPLQRASALGQRDSNMPLAWANSSMAQAMTCALEQRVSPSHAHESEQPNKMMCTFSIDAFSHMFATYQLYTLVVAVTLLPAPTVVQLVSCLYVDSA